MNGKSHPPPPPPPPVQYPYPSVYCGPSPPRSVRHDNAEVSIDLSNGRTLKIKRSDLCLEDVDIIVSSANFRLQHQEGVALALDKASNGVLQRHSDRHVLHSGELEEGDIVVTPAGGKLKCKHVIHAMGPFVQLNPSRDSNVLFNVVNKCLAEAEKLQAHSIAFTTIGTGRRGLKPEVITYSMLESIMTFKYTGFGVKDIRIVTLNEQMFKTFAREIGCRKSQPDRRRGITGRVFSYLFGDQSSHSVSSN